MASLATVMTDEALPVAVAAAAGGCPVYTNILLVLCGISQALDSLQRAGWQTRRKDGKTF